MAKIKNTKNCSYQIDGVSLTPEYGELEVDDNRAQELCQLDGIEIVEYDEVEVPTIAAQPPLDFDPIPEKDTKIEAETPKKKRGRKTKKK